MSIQEQILELEAKRATLDPNNIIQLSEIEQIDRKISDLNKQQEIIAKNEERIYDEITFAVAGVDFSSLPTEFIQLAHKIVRNDRIKLVNEHKADIEELHKSYQSKLSAAEDRELQYKRQNESLQNTNRELEEQLLELQIEHEEQIAELKEKLRIKGQDFLEQQMKRNDAESKKEAAQKELEEAQREIESLKEQVTNLTKQLEEKPKSTVIETDQESAEEMQNLVDTIATKYTGKIEDWGSILKVEKEDGTFELKKRDEVEMLRETGQLPMPPLTFCFEDEGDNPTDSASDQVDITDEVSFRTPTEVDGVQSTDEQEVVGGEGQNDHALGTQSWQEWVDKELKALIAWKESQGS